MWAVADTLPIFFAAASVCGHRRGQLPLILSPLSFCVFLYLPGVLLVFSFDSPYSTFFSLVVYVLPRPLPSLSLWLSFLTSVCMPVQRFVTFCKYQFRHLPLPSFSQCQIVNSFSTIFNSLDPRLYPAAENGRFPMRIKPTIPGEWVSPSTPQNIRG